MTISIVLAYTTLGAVAGVLAGLLGVGGGLVIVPVLTFLFQAQGFDPTVVVHLAIGTSLATIVLTGISSVRAHHQHRAVRWPVVGTLTPGIIVGTMLGAELVHLLPTATLKVVFGLFELAVATKIGMGIQPTPKRSPPGQVATTDVDTRVHGASRSLHEHLPARVAMTGVGTLIGFVSGIVGIGGGTLTVPFLVWCNTPIRNAVATSAACGVPIAVSGTISFVWIGWAAAALPTYSFGYLYWPALLGVAAASMLTAPFGAKLAHRLPTILLSRILAVFLCILGVQMLLSV